MCWNSSSNNIVLLFFNPQTEEWCIYLIRKCSFSSLSLWSSCMIKEICESEPNIQLLVVKAGLLCSEPCFRAGLLPHACRATQVQKPSTMTFKRSAPRCPSKWWRLWPWLTVREASFLSGVVVIFSSFVIPVCWCFSLQLTSTSPWRWMRAAGPGWFVEKVWSYGRFAKLPSPRCGAQTPQRILDDFQPCLTLTRRVFLQLLVCKELQLPSSQYEYSADLVAVTSATPLEAAPVQSISVLAVTAEGTARFWPSLAHEGNYTESDVDLGDLCNFAVAVRVRTLQVFFWFSSILVWIFIFSARSALRVEASWYRPSGITCWGWVLIPRGSCSIEICSRVRGCCRASGAASPACLASSPHQPMTLWAPLWVPPFVHDLLHVCLTLLRFLSSTVCCGRDKPAACTRWPPPAWASGRWTTARSDRSSAGTPAELWRRASPTPSGSVESTHTVPASLLSSELL